MGSRFHGLLAAWFLLTIASSATAQVFSATGLPMPIPDFPTVTSTISVTGGPTSVMQLELVLRADHTALNQLDILLVRGTKYLHLTSDNGGSADNFANVRFRDAAADSIAAISTTANNVVGDFRPEGGTISLSGATFSLSGLTRTADFAEFISGESGDGDWTLVVDDDSNGQTGSLLYWSLEFNGAADPTGPVNTPPPPAFAGDFLATPNLLVFGTPVTGTTRWNGPAGAQPGITDGAGEEPLTAYAGAPFGQDYPNREVAYRYVHAGGPVAFRLSGTSTDVALIVIDATGTPAGAIAVVDAAFGSNPETAAFLDLAPGTYYIVVDVASDQSAGTNFVLDTGIPPANDACTDAAALTTTASVPFNTSFSTSAEFNADFCFGTAASPDIWYSLIPTQSGVTTLEICDADFAANLSAQITCADLPLRCSREGCTTNPSLPVLRVCTTPGVPINIRVSGFLDEIGSGTLNVSFEPGGSTYSPPPGTLEGEICRGENDDIDTVNGGCDTGAALYTPIAPGQTIVGTISNYIGFSVTDTDQYVFTLVSDATVTVTGQAESDVLVDLISDALDCGAASPMGLTVGNLAPCRPGFSLTASLAAGDYAISISPSDLDNFCEDPGNAYWVRLDVTQACPADFNNSGAVTIQDIFDFLAAYFSQDLSADFNGSGDITVQDVFDFLAAYFTPCP